MLEEDLTAMIKLIATDMDGHFCAMTRHTTERYLLMCTSRWWPRESSLWLLAGTNIINSNHFLRNIQTPFILRRTARTSGRWTTSIKLTSSVRHGLLRCRKLSKMYCTWILLSAVLEAPISFVRLHRATRKRPGNFCIICGPPKW